MQSCTKVDHPSQPEGDLSRWCADRAASIGRAGGAARQPQTTHATLDAVRLQLGLRLRLQPLPAPWRIVELPNGLAVDDTNWHTSPARMGRRKLELLRRTQRRIRTLAARYREGPVTPRGVAVFEIGACPKVA